MEKTIRCAAVAALVSLAGASAGAFPLKDAVVVHADGLRGGRWGFQAVEVFTNTVKKLTGADVKVYTEKNAAQAKGFKFYFGPTRAAKAAGIDVSAYAPVEFRLKVTDDAAYLAGIGGQAAAFAMTEFFLAETDYRFLTMDGKGDPFTYDPALEVKPCDIRRKARFPCFSNSIWTTYKNKRRAATRADWMLRARAVTDLGGLGKRFLQSKKTRYCHSWYDYCPPDKYFKDHPEYYSLDEQGHRCGTAQQASELCLSNPEVLRICTESLERFIEEDLKERPDNPPGFYDFTQMDNAGYICRCPKCAEIAKRYDAKGGFLHGGDAGLQIWFVNQMMKRIKEKHPDVLVRIFAYVSTEEPPVGIVPDDNVIVWLCDLYSTSCHDLPLTHPFNGHRKELFEQWAKIAKHLEIWDYQLYGASYPDVMVDAIHDDVAFLSTLGYDRHNDENHDKGQPFWELNIYAKARFMFDADLTADQVVDEYCRVYGKGSGPMKRAINYLRKVMRENPPASANSWHLRILPWRTAETWEKVLALCREADRLAAGQPEAQKHIRRVMVSAARDLIVKLRGVPGKEARYAEVKAEFKRLIEKDALDPKDEQLFVELIDLEFTDLPPELKKVDKKQLVFLDSRSVPWKPKERLVFHDEPSVPSGKAFKLIDWLGRSGKDVFQGVVVGEAPRVTLNVKPVADGQYHWYKAGTIDLPRATIIWFGGLGFDVASHYIEKDGLDFNPDKVDVWVSVKYTGDYPAKATPEKGFFVSRMILHRVEAGPQTK